ncbi:MAG: hypothetical protein JW852_10650, partial [Spirochaetales bacterium]|nr:hypothetical protein [Spirochaetales bacterium]
TQIMERKGFSDVNRLMDESLHQANVSFCTRKHFGRTLPGETGHYLRLAYSGIGVADIQEGLAALKRYFEA